jgi:hypothetical protein
MLGKKLLTRLWRKGLHLIADIGKSMKNYLMICAQTSLDFPCPFKCGKAVDAPVPRAEPPRSQWFAAPVDLHPSNAPTSSALID